MQQIENYEDKQVYTYNTTIELFSSSYINNDITIIESYNDDSIISPESLDTYTFHIQNISHNTIDYKLMFDTSTTSLIYIPVEVRIKRDDGLWIAGDEQSYVSMESINDITDV